MGRAVASGGMRPVPLSELALAIRRFSLHPSVHVFSWNGALAFVCVFPTTFVFG